MSFLQSVVVCAISVLILSYIPDQKRKLRRTERYAKCFWESNGDDAPAQYLIDIVALCKWPMAMRTKDLLPGKFYDKACVNDSAALDHGNFYLTVSFCYGNPSQASFLSSCHNLCVDLLFGAQFLSSMTIFQVRRGQFPRAPVRLLPHLQALFRCTWALYAESSASCQWIGTYP